MKSTRVRSPRAFHVAKFNFGSPREHVYGPFPNSLMRETHLNHEDGEDEQTDAVENQSWIDSVGFTLCKKTHTGMFLVEQVDGRMKNYVGQEGKRKNQLLSGVEVSRRDWKSSGLRTELQLPDNGCFPTFPPSSFPLPPELCTQVQCTGHWATTPRQKLVFPPFPSLYSKFYCQWEVVHLATSHWQVYIQKVLQGLENVKDASYLLWKESVSPLIISLLQ